jgi:hypothetical protein
MRYTSNTEEFFLDPLINDYYTQGQEKDRLKQGGRNLEIDLLSGVHRSPDVKYFTTAYLHHPEELKQEIKECGFKNVSLLAVEGPVWDRMAIENLKNDPEVWQELLSFLETIENDESIIGSSSHIIAIVKKQ